MSQNNINSFAQNMRNVIGQQANELSMLTALQRSLTTNDTFVTYEYQDVQGKNSRYQLPSYASIVNRLKSLEESVNSLSTGHGTINLTDGSRRTITLSSIPHTPEQISGLEDPSTFKIDTNWFFEELMFPGMTVDIDLTGNLRMELDPYAEGSDHLNCSIDNDLFLLYIISVLLEKIGNISCGYGAVKLASLTALHLQSKCFITHTSFINC